MKKPAKLIGFSPIIPDINTFVQPIFEAGNQFALQVEKKGKIASLKLFNIDESVIRITSRLGLYVSVGSNAIFGFQPMRGRVWFGEFEVLAEKIKTEWLNEKIGKKADAGTLATVQDFIRASPPSRKNYRDQYSRKGVSIYHRNSNGSWFQISTNTNSSNTSQELEIYSTPSVESMPHLFRRIKDREQPKDLTSRTISFAVPFRSTESEIRAMFETLGAVERVEFEPISSQRHNAAGFRVRTIPRKPLGGLFNEQPNSAIKHCKVIMKYHNSALKARSAIEARDLGVSWLATLIQKTRTGAINRRRLEKFTLTKDTEKSSFRIPRGKISGVRSGSAKK